MELISCSIDPTPEGLDAMQQFLRGVGSTFQRRPRAGDRRPLGRRAAEQPRDAERDDHRRVDQDPFRPGLVEADYRMKLIGIGLEQPPIRMASFIDRVNPSQVARNALFRWFFIPEYSCVRVSEDGLAMELVGDGVKLVGEDEMVASGGKRVISGRSNIASQAFVTSFTQNILWPIARRSTRGCGT